MLFKLPPEFAHEFGMVALRLGLAGGSPYSAADKRVEPIERFGLKFSNPFGMAAGFDKNGLVVDQLAALGFGFVEVGTVTLEPQPGNEKPRLFRLPEDDALINRLGFNNQGAESIAQRLRNITKKCIVGVNIGRNKNVPNEEAIENYLECFDRVYEVADYIAVNISSPNTPNLRELQKAENLEELLAAIQKRNTKFGPKPLLVKIAPDLSDSEIEAVVDICVRLGISGIIATNTTVKREALKTINTERFGDGGLSGRPLTERSNQVISKIYRYSKGKMPIVGVGGVFTADDAFAKIAAGACLVQAYTAFIYRGPSFAHDINSGLLRIMREKGFSLIDQAVGSCVR
jgi:dihydroorotate dehydrogenase